jgi:hypothetical protein
MSAIGESNELQDIIENYHISVKNIRAIGKETVDRFLDQLEPHLTAVQQRTPEAAENLAIFLDTLTLATVGLKDPDLK